MSDPQPQTVINVPASFKLVFIVVVALTLLSFLGIAALALWGGDGKTDADLSIFQKNFYSACSLGWQAGLGAILGLIGGKVTQ
jgi:hypothetical protein